MPYLSIITPVYNGGKMFQHCIKSIIKQSFQDWEWIIINDASTDSTSQILMNLATKDARIRIINNSHNQGESISRAKAIAHVNGKYTMFVDADDKLENKSLSALMSTVKQNEGGDIFVFGSKLNYPKLKIRVPFYQPTEDPEFENSQQTGHNACLNVLANNGMLPNLWDKIYRSDFLQQHIGELPALKVGVDYIMNIRLTAHAEKVQAIPGMFYLWTYSGLGKKYYLDRWEEYMYSIDCAMDELPTLAAETALGLDEALTCLSINYMKCLQESCVQRLLRKDSTEKIANFISTAMKHPVLQHLQEWQGIATHQLSAEIFINLSLKHLRNHKKYYTFTRVLNLFS